MAKAYSYCTGYFTGKASCLPINLQNFSTSNDLQCMVLQFGYHSYLLSSDPTQTVLFFLLADDNEGWMMVTLVILNILLTLGTMKTWTLLTLLMPVSTVNSMATICATLELLVATHKMLSPMYAAQSICSVWCIGNLYFNCIYNYNCVHTNI